MLPIFVLAVRVIVLVLCGLLGVKRMFVEKFQESSGQIVHFLLSALRKARQTEHIIEVV